MQTQSRSSSSSTILLILVLVLTAPFWLAVGGVLLGVLGGIFGAIFGVFGALIGAFFAIVTLPFKLLFGSCEIFDHGHGFFHVSGRAIFFLVMVVLLVTALKRR